MLGAPSSQLAPIQKTEDVGVTTSMVVPDLPKGVTNHGCPNIANSLVISMSFSFGGIRFHKPNMSLELVPLVPGNYNLFAGEKLCFQVL